MEAFFGSHRSSGDPMMKQGVYGYLAGTDRESSRHRACTAGTCRNRAGTESAPSGTEPRTGTKQNRASTKRNSDRAGTRRHRAGTAGPKASVNREPMIQQSMMEPSKGRGKGRNGRRQVQGPGRGWGLPAANFAQSRRRTCRPHTGGNYVCKMCHGACHSVLGGGEE